MNEVSRLVAVIVAVGFVPALTGTRDATAAVAEEAKSLFKNNLGIQRS